MSGPDSQGNQSNIAALAAPLRTIIVTVGVALAVTAVLNIFSGNYATSAVSMAASIASFFAWRILHRGDLHLAATIAFYALAIALTAFLWSGHGTRDYGLAGFPALLFLGCVFLTSIAYWGLAGCVLAGISLLGFAELAGLLPHAVGPKPELQNLIELWVIIGASAVGGRVLMHAVLGSVARESSLSGALQTSEDRMRKVFRTSQNAIVVSRMSDGTYLDVNDAFLAMFGYSRLEVIGHTSIELGIWEDLRDRQRFLAALQEGKPVKGMETRQRKKSGDALDLQLSAEAFEMDGVKCLMITATDLTATRQAERRAEFLSTRDPLTGLPNRTLALDRLQQGIQRARLSGDALAILHIDLDRFSAINDSIGRVLGDIALRETAGRIEKLFQRGCTFARIGGNEFLLISDSLTSAADAKALATSVLAALEPTFTIGGHQLRISCSIGISAFPDDSEDAETLMLYADTALHVAKREGRNRFCLFDQAMTLRAQDRGLVESCLRESLAARELSLAYQPKFNMRTGAITGVEALARWTHPKLGEVEPAHFISIAEESDLICDLGRWVLDEACSQIAQWQKDGLPVVPIAVNLSARQINADLPKLLWDRGQAHGVVPGLLELEVTETMLILRPEATRNALEQISKNGNSIVLDDFGVGYSSLSYVKLLHLNGIKIDRSFVEEVTSSRHDRAIVSAIVELSHGLGFRVVAEGIETEEQLQVLRSLGCDEAQGFHLSRPLTAQLIASTYLASSVGGSA